MAFFPWKQYPFLRILPPLIAGIWLQWNYPVPVITLLLIALFSLFVFIAYFFIRIRWRYRLAAISGISSLFLYFAAGALLCHYQDIRRPQTWAGYTMQHTIAWKVRLLENPQIKEKTYKVTAEFRARADSTTCRNITGKLILYLAKDSTAARLKAGDEICFRKKPVLIPPNHNPGAFNFHRYCLFQGITHQLYLLPEEFRITRKAAVNDLRYWSSHSSSAIIGLLQRYIPGNSTAGLAEALLIGYKNDLDPGLVKTYSNTGTIHIIAISGMHLGLIYGLLLLLLAPLKKKKGVHAALIITALWLFSVLAGASPSVLRSALMFTCMIAGRAISRSAGGIHALSLSAFILLCYNPFWLWDAGFQLSYAAVLSILLFMQPLYRLFYFSNRLPDLIWQLNSVTLSAQLLTLPVSIYHFHQFPVWFLLSNFIAVPLSGLILYAVLLLLPATFYPPLAIFAGKVVAAGIHLMNAVVQRVEALPFAVWDGLVISSTQAFSLGAFISVAAWGLIQQRRKALYTAMLLLLCCQLEGTVNRIRADRQQLLIIYQLPGHTALDFISGRRYFPVSDSAVLSDQRICTNQLIPARRQYRLTGPAVLKELSLQESLYSYSDKRILHVHGNAVFRPGSERTRIDCLLLSGNSTVRLDSLLSRLDIRQVVIDGSVPPGKARYREMDCRKAGIPCHNTAMKGAFVLPLN